jgi:hypothetical protein
MDSTKRTTRELQTAKRLDEDGRSLLASLRPPRRSAITPAYTHA